MSKREKFIVISAALSVIFGVYYFFVSSPSGAGMKIIENPSDTKMMLDEINPVLLKGRLSSSEFFILENAKKSWNDSMAVMPDPLSELEKKSETFDEKYSPLYSGYIKMGSRTMAVLDGMEYKPGDELKEGGGYFVVSISPANVVIQKPGKESRVITIAEDKN